MHFPKFWRLAKKGGVTAWGWSDDSPEAALGDGLSRVDRCIQWLKDGLKDERGPYGYPDRPMREEMVKEFRDAKGELFGAVTRNSYGCLVLNTERLLFVDIDEPESGFGALFGGLFGKKKGFEESVLPNVQRWVDQHPGWGFRVYRTRAGIRLMAVHAEISATDPVCVEVFAMFKADRLYRKLCVAQKCFRARVTPKPWRCGAGKPVLRWPWKDAEAESRFKTWETKYLRASEAHSVCRLVGEIGVRTVHPALGEMVAFHDAACRIDTSLPLA